MEMNRRVSTWESFPSGKDHFKHNLWMNINYLLFSRENDQCVSRLDWSVRDIPARKRQKEKKKKKRKKEKKRKKRKKIGWADKGKHVKVVVVAVFKKRWGLSDESEESSRRSGGIIFLLFFSFLFFSFFPFLFLFLPFLVCTSTVPYS